MAANSGERASLAFTRQRSLVRNEHRPLRRTAYLRGKVPITHAFRFVDDHTEAGCTPEWAALARQWNARNPEDKFWEGSDLKRAYERSKKRLASAWVDERHRASEQARSCDV